MLREAVGSDFMTARLATPFSHRPLAWHFSVALLVLLAVAGAINWLLIQQSRELAKAHAALTSQKQSSQLKELQTAIPVRPFASRLPEMLRIDEVVKQVLAGAGQSGIVMNSIAVTPVRGTQREYPKFEIAVHASGGYGETKQWLADLLGRYPSLAVQSLSMRAGASSDGARVESQWVLTFYARD